MFDKKIFSNILIRINSLYSNQREFAETTGVDRAYLSRLMNQKLNNPPTPKILQKIADNSKNITTYEELMEICGYIYKFDTSKIVDSLNINVPSNTKGISSIIELLEDLDEKDLEDVKDYIKFIKSKKKGD